MVKYKNIIFVVLIIFFLIFSFYPTIFELQNANNLADKRREFVLEHNYYWPDYNLYLSKIKQGIDGRLTAVEKYTSEKHAGSLIQEFYVVLGWLGRIFNLAPNDVYLWGRIIISPLLLIIIILLVKAYFKSFTWQIIAFLVTVTSASFPRFYTDALGTLQVGRFMEWWSNIDALERITFIPHILFGQVASFYLLYQITNNRQQITWKRFVFYVLLANLAGLTFPPSLITLDSVLFLILIFRYIKQRKRMEVSEKFGIEGAFIMSTLPSLLYILFITKFIPWSALVDFHSTHPMMIPFDQYILGTGPIFFLGLLGAITSIINRDRRMQPLIFWILATFSFAAFFSVVKDQSPLRFTQTGLFIPLGILGSYLFYQLFHLSDLGNLNDLSRSQLKAGLIILLAIYLGGNLYMMKVSLGWQITWLSQKIAADTPLVPYPPQAMYPLRSWMDGIRWLKYDTDENDVVLAEITAGNYIPAYSGNFVYWGQSNTVDYNRKELEVDKFFEGKMTESEAQIFLKNGHVKYIFFSIQEKDLSAGSPRGGAGKAGKAGGKNLEEIYPFIKSLYNNPLVTIYSF